MNYKTPSKTTDYNHSDNGLHYTDKQVKRITRWLVSIISAGLILGFITAIIGIVVDGSADEHTFLGLLSYILVGAGVVIPLVVAGWLGGRAINRFGGLFGLFLVVGIISVGLHASFNIPWLLLPGIILTVTSIVVFFYMGIQAKLPIWLQLPMLGSPRLYISKGDYKNPKK